MEKSKKNILIATAFPTHGAGSGALVTTQAKSYVEDGHNVVIITGNNRTDFDKLDGVRYHIVPFTAETENPEKIEGQAPFNYLMFTTHTESTANFWNVGLKELEQYCQTFRDALKQETKDFNPNVIHAQHNWLLSSCATEMGKPVVTTIHGTDLMGYEKSKQKLQETLAQIEQMHTEAKSGKGDITQSDFAKIEEVFARSSSYDEITAQMKNLLSGKQLTASKSSIMQAMQVFEDKKKYEMYIREAEKSAKNSEKIIVISDAQKEKFVSLFPYAADKVELLENGYDPKTFYVDKNVDREEVLSGLTSDRTPDGKLPTDYDKMALFVGKFADFKGIDSLLVASKQYEEKMAEQGKKPLIVIVGSGALEDKLKTQADKLGLENTHFVGRQPHSVIRNLQNLSDFSLIPSRDEPFGLVVIEGTACGHPVIASNSGGIPGILNTTKEKLPNKNIIQTPLGVLIKPLPDRPTSLTDEQRDELDLLTIDYINETDEDKKEAIAETSVKFGFKDTAEAEKYLKDYADSTEALSTSMMEISNGKMQFDGQKIADYTKENYSQDVIRDKLIGIFDDAEQIYSVKKNRNLDE